MKTNKLMDEIRATMTPEMKTQMELSVGIANRIHIIMDAKNLSQKELAKLVGKTETEVSRWLSGTHNFTMATIAKIATAVGDPIITPATRKPTRTLSQEK